MKKMDIEIAKKRIWKNLQAKLPDRGVPEHAQMMPVIRAFRDTVKVSPLRRVQFKENILDVLPERMPAFSFAIPRQMWALGSLGLLLVGIFVPVLRWTPTASASSENILETVSGEVYVNGQLVLGNTLLQNGDRIETGEGAMAHVYFLDDSRMTLGPSSQVDIVNSVVDPLNQAKTEVKVRENAGRVWVQVLNLVSNDSYFQLVFPEGDVLVTQKASFDVQVSDAGTEVEVARNLVQASVSSGELNYQGVLGQGAELLVTDKVSTTMVAESTMTEVWWTFNLAYGKSYARTLDENYKKENVNRAIILPGNPLYGLKTFRENLQASLAFSASAKQNLLVEQAQNRLDEAQTLLARGQEAEAVEVLNAYQRTVEQASNTNNEALLAQVDEAQKQVLLSGDASGAQLLQDHLSDASATVFASFTEKNEVKLASASQQLQQVPDLLDAGHYNDALGVLSDYQDRSLSLLSELEAVPMDQRETVVSSLLEQKIADLQLLRVIASMPELGEELDADLSILQQLSVMVLSLREKELGDLSNFFDSHHFDIQTQEAMYNRLKDGAQITPMLSEQLDSVEAQLDSAQNATVVMDVQPVDAVDMVDPRFSVPHADESNNESQGGH